MTSLGCPSAFTAALLGAVLSGLLPTEAAVPVGARDDQPMPLDRLMTTFVARGRGREEVERRLGPPACRLSADAWVYWDCESSMPEDVARGFSAMIILFTDGRVSGIRLAPRKNVEALIAHLKATKESAARTSVAVTAAK